MYWFSSESGCSRFHIGSSLPLQQSETCQHTVWPEIIRSKYRQAIANAGSSLSQQLALPTNTGSSHLTLPFSFCHGGVQQVIVSQSCHHVRERWVKTGDDIMKGLHKLKLEIQAGAESLLLIQPLSLTEAIYKCTTSSSE